MGDKEVPCFVNGHDQVVVELDPTDDFQLFIRALKSLRDGMETDFRGGLPYPPWDVWRFGR